MADRELATRLEDGYTLMEAVVVVCGLGVVLGAIAAGFAAIHFILKVW